MGSALSSNGGHDAKSEADAAEMFFFPQFGRLGDDLVVEVLSFVSDGPYERDLEDARGTLTQALPLVCRRFREYCDGSDSLWMPSLERMVTLNPNLWEDGIRSIVSSVRSIPLAMSTLAEVYPCDSHTKGGGNLRQSQGTWSEFNSLGKEGRCIRSMTQDEIRQLLDVICKISTQEAFRNRAATNNGSHGDRVVDKHEAEHGQNNRKRPASCPAKVAYRSLVTKHMVVTMPVFYMPSRMRLNQAIGVHFFEPRYRRLIAEVTAGRTGDEQSGGQLTAPLPRFVYACTADPLVAAGRTAEAFVVEVHRCRIYVNGRADVLLCPVKSVRLVKVEERAGSDGLCDAVFKRA